MQTSRTQYLLTLVLMVVEIAKPPHLRGVPVPRGHASQVHRYHHITTSMDDCRSTTRSEQTLEADGAVEDDPLAAAKTRVRRLEQLLCLRRFYRNCVRAEAYHRNTAPVYMPFTEAELAEMPGDDDRQEAFEARRSDSLDILADMVVVREQLQVSPS